MYLNFRSQKGAAIVLVAILVTGIVMLVSVIAIENLRKSTEMQGVQKKSLDSLYKAEEGAEYGLYVNKEKTAGNFERPFDISVWEKVGDSSVTKTGDQALEQLAQPTEGRNIVITSQSLANANDSQEAAPQKTIFTNLPNKYYDQVSLWNIWEGCDNLNQSCDVSYDNNDMEPDKTYQVVVPSAIFDKSGWTDNETEYRLVFKCGNSQYWKGTLSGTENVGGCKITDVKLEIGGCDTSKCKIEGCAKTIPIDFSNGNEGKILPTEWFRIDDPDTQEPINLTNEKIVVEFTLEEGTMEEVCSNGTGGDLKMCRINDDNDVTTFKDPPLNCQGGLSSMEVRKFSEYKGSSGADYACCGYKQICNTVCDSGYDDCCNGHNYQCDGYPSNNSLCNSGNAGSCCYSSVDPCNGSTFCQNSCTDTCNEGGTCFFCDVSHPVCHNGSCNKWCK
ncbi:MAG: hypothetical protein V1690_03230 [Candidatus Moraniibacteriota bacterium]